MKGLRGKKALITGGSRGIGAATAELLAEYGVDLALGYRARQADADQLARTLRDEHGVNVVTHASDISTVEGAESLVGRAADGLGGIDVFVGSAGIWIGDDVELTDMTDAQWRRTMAENIDAMFYVTRAVTRRINDHGRIVLVGSTAGQRGEAGHADYAATKGAMMSFVKSLAPELGKRDINVNCVAPGWVDTEMTAAAMTSIGRERIAAGIPIGRVASPRDVAGPIVFLCSELARHVTGEVLNVNGGSVLCG